MNGNIDGLREAVRESLKALSGSFERLTALMDDRKFTTDRELRKELLRLEAASKQNRERLNAARADFEKWVSEESQTRNQIDAWKAKRNTGRLHTRADLCEKCTIAALELSALAILEAECAAFRAVLARKEAVAVQVREH